MFTNPQNTLISTLIFIFFKLTIFLLLIIQLYKLTKQYIIPFLQEQINLVNKIWTELKNKLKLLVQTKKRIEKQIETQSQSLEDLEKKVKQWHEKLLEKQALIKKEKVKLHEQLEKKQTKQQSYLDLVKTEKTVLPEAILEAKTKLIKLYKNENGKKLLTNVINHLKTNKTELV